MRLGASAFVSRLACLAAFALPLLAAPPAVAQQVRVERLELPADGNVLRVAGKVRGKVIEDRILEARAGQRLSLRLKVVHPAFRLEVLPPEGPSIFEGRRKADRFEATLPADGYYTLRARLTGSAARTGQTVGYVMGVALADAGAALRDASSAAAAE
ncbi:MAG: hypothetical protein ACQEUZ_15770 [Pseudomonadota bacterium]